METSASGGCKKVHHSKTLAARAPSVLAFALAALALAACGQASPSSGSAAADTSYWSPGDATTSKDSIVALDVDAGPADTSAVDGDVGDTTGGADSSELADVADAQADIAVITTCPGAAGCSCASGKDCQNSLCLDTPDGLRCATPCGNGCGDGQSCATLSQANGTEAKVCVQTWGKLCYPCTATKDCQEPGVSGSLCMDQGALGRFCGAACQTVADCPNGYDCQVGQSPEGPKTLQCVRVTSDGKSIGTCACTPAAKAAALFTPCYAEQKNLAGKVVGQCPGVRMCAPTGLGACTLVAVKAEVCDGIDNDCNGLIDEDASGCGDGQACVAGKCEANCVPVDGGWSPWVAGSCSAACGGGTLVSTRTCTSPAATCGGAPCAGDAQKSEVCNTQACIGDQLPIGSTSYTVGGQVVKGLVPAGKTSLMLLIWGGGGGGGYPGNGGGAGFGQLSVPVSAGDAIELRVAEGGSKYAGGGASYVLRNGNAVVVIGGGGGAGVDGCSGCNGGPGAGAGGVGGAIGASAGAGTANNYVNTNSGGGLGGTQSAGGLGGKQANASSYEGCTEDGVAGSANTGGAGIGGNLCPPASGKCLASFEKAGSDCPGNGGSGGGGAGWFGGGSGAAMYTYTGGGGGGGSSWAAADVTVIKSETGSGTNPGGVFAASWQGQAGSGGLGLQQAFAGDPKSGRPGQINLTL